MDRVLNQTYTLESGVEIPRLGLGTWLMDDAEAKGAVVAAAACSYRMFDTAQAYGNEAGVGEGVRSCSVPRDQLFVASKIAVELKDYDSAKASIDETLSKMGLDYLDQVIIHSPQPWVEVNQSENRYEQGNLEAWRALEEAQASTPAAAWPPPSMACPWTASRSSSSSRASRATATAPSGFATTSSNRTYRTT